MRGIVVLTVLMTFEDAAEIERRTEVRMLSDPKRWPSRTEALLQEIGVGPKTFLVPRGTRVLSVEPEPDAAAAHVVPAYVMEADVVVGGSTALRRRLHEEYFDQLKAEQSGDAHWTSPGFVDI